jgi:hypothetical protein
MIPLKIKTFLCIQMLQDMTMMISKKRGPEVAA